MEECSTAGEWIKKTWYGHATGYNVIFTGKEILQRAATWMNPEDMMPRKLSQSQKDTHHFYEDSTIEPRKGMLVARV